jgi:hypothetical protein
MKRIKGEAQTTKVRGTSGIVSDYRLDDRASIPGRGKRFFSSLCLQTNSEAHPVSYSMGAGGGELLSRGQKSRLPSGRSRQVPFKHTSLFNISLYLIHTYITFETHTNLLV